MEGSICIGGVFLRRRGGNVCILFASTKNKVAVIDVGPQPYRRFIFKSGALILVEATIHPYQPSSIDDSLFDTFFPCN